MSIVSVVNGERYRGVFLVAIPRPFVTRELAIERMAAAGFGAPTVWLNAEDLPADWPMTRRYGDTDAGWHVYAEGTWTGPTADMPLPHAAVDVWRVETHDPAPPATPPVSPPSTPPFVPPAVPPMVPPVVPQPPAPPTTKPDRRPWVIAGLFALAGLVTAACLSASSSDE